MKFLSLLLLFISFNSLHSQSLTIRDYYAKLYASSDMDIDAKINVYKELLNSDLPLKKFIYPVLIRSYAEKKDTFIKFNFITLHS